MNRCVESDVYGVWGEYSWGSTVIFANSLEYETIWIKVSNKGNFEGYSLCDCCCFFNESGSICTAVYSKQMKSDRTGNHDDTFGNFSIFTW